ncbi:hypothetical protein P175DRAFT_0521320 [Aspergillus ochraceoroseus IBT 24754]|uniref:Zn(2)-C6 fungal-type domain-containing protein n=2 Tax=Aspergillus ochraceoroseus TaxID=138278 RepID=A0A2T5MAK4_9EURO|nr:uncharacterized protein P175DRAFT_0521320 [Aspergillus ochraceoroseus IBT 24754]KKK22939.1 hypothetical protein AOCH_007518 [Aspergillus ochraceoroseus]PTU25572.1 hypothetical protein P175DRAFT_0521320 [Aspergillus ochraceoroseus IBT 24754]
MEIPPKARGPGRSGPRRRTGCLTCRARKVRCDEVKPTCANCTRLRLQCIYRSVIIPGIGSRSPQSPRETGAASDLSLLSQLTPIPPQQPPRTHTIPPASGSSGAVEFPVPFDMLSFIGEINSDFQQKHLDLTHDGAMAPSPVVQANDGLFHDERQMTWGPRELGDGGNIPESESSPRTATSAGGTVWEERLLEHFRESQPPPTIFGPVDLEWKYVRDIIAVQSGICRMLLPAIYCYSDIHKAFVEGRRWKLAQTYHHQASTEIQSCLFGEVSEPVLRRAFTGVLLLMLAELLSPDGWRPPTSYLHTAYLLLQRFHPRTRSWTGFSRLIISWVSLLDIKALVAGRDGDPLSELGNLTEPETLTTCTATAATLPHQQQPKDDNANPEDENTDTLLLLLLLPTQPSYLIYNAIVGPAFHFFLQAQQVTRRIVCIDLHHRTRGTVSDEFEVLQIAHQVGADLETLWNRRPKVLDIYERPDALLDTLAPHLAVTICRTFRQYVAGFLALFVYLHRVAFAIYPRTDRVYRAVDQIIQLARVEAHRDQHVPASFVWPLFIAGLEGSMEQRTFIVHEIQRMAALEEAVGVSVSPNATSNGTPGSELGIGGTAARHPNATKALVLLEEMTRRQDTSHTWADSRCVRRELFADFFVMI